MNRKIQLALRRKVKSIQRFDIEYVGGDRGDMVKTTCKSCGFSELHPLGGWNKAKKLGAKTPAELTKKLVAYQQSGCGISGVCPRCTKHKRDEKFPLR